MRSDPALLRRILQNFLSNARRYTDTGRVLVGCRRRGGAVAIQVHDTGVGIAENDQEAIFEEFKRLAGSDKSASRGLGLGLAIVERIARLLDHPVGMRSTLGHGSCFEVLVPVSDSREGRASATSDQRRPVASELSQQVILCIDNEPDILEGMHQLLTRWGAEPVTATSTEEALAALSELQQSRGQGPDMLIVDYHLDDGAIGTEAIEAVHNALDRAIPAIVVTADHTDEVTGAVRDAGFALLHKPLKPAALRASMMSILSRRDVA